MTTSQERAEERATAADNRTQELGPNDARPPFTTAPAYVHGVDPETQTSVTFTPGEALPDWAAARLPHATVDDNGVLTLPGQVMPAAPPEKATGRRR